MACLQLAACVFEQTVFESGLTRPAASLEGLWEAVDANGNVQHAALFPLGDRTSLLQYPMTTNGWWFEAQSLQINGRDLLQLRVLAGPEVKPAGAGAKNYTLAWLEKQTDGTVQMRALNGQSIEQGKFTAASLRTFLSDSAQDWNTVFGTPSTFRRPADKK